MISMPLNWAWLALSLALLSSMAAVMTIWVPSLLRRLGMPLFATAGLAALVGGLIALIQGDQSTAVLPLGLPWLPWHVRLDALSGFFLCIIWYGTRHPAIRPATIAP